MVNHIALISQVGLYTVSIVFVWLL